MSKRRGLVLILLGIVGGLLGECVLLVRSHTLDAQRLLLDDFRILAFLDGDPHDERRKVVEEKLLALPGTESVDYFSPKESLARMESRDPHIAESVTLLGENPLPGAFEVRLERENMAGLPAWIHSAEAIEGVAELLYRPMQAQTILRLQLYGRFLSLILALAGFILAAAVVGWLLSLWKDVTAPPALSGLARSAGLVGAGVAAGAGVTALLSQPLSQDWASHWPAWWAQSALLLGGILGGLLVEGFSLRHAARGRGKALIAAAILCLGAGSASASSLTERQRELEKVRSDLNNHRKEIEKIREWRGAMETDLVRLQRENRRNQQRLEALKERRSEIEGTQARLSGKLSALGSARQRGLRVLSEELTEYSQQSVVGGRFYGSDHLWEESLRRSALRQRTRYLAQLTRIEARTAVEHTHALEGGRRVQAGMAKELRHLEDGQKSLVQTRKSFADVSSKLAGAEKRFRELEVSARALENLIQQLGRRGPKRGSQPALPPVAKHSLPWPARGRIVSQFGRHKNPDLGTWTIQNGVEIAAGKGQAVSPVLAGTVIFAGSFRSYGNVVIVDHGAGFYSIYGQLGNVLRRKGERVHPETRLATVGEHLYLELRQAGKPLDPAVWLRKK